MTDHPSSAHLSAGEIISRSVAPVSEPSPGFGDMTKMIVVCCNINGVPQSYAGWVKRTDSDALLKQFVDNIIA